jgi:hypothetical protein
MARATTRPRPSTSPRASADWRPSSSSRRPGACRPRNAHSPRAIRRASAASGVPASCRCWRSSRQISTTTSWATSSEVPWASVRSSTRWCHWGSRMPAGYPDRESSCSKPYATREVTTPSAGGSSLPDPPEGGSGSRGSGSSPGSGSRPPPWNEPTTAASRAPGARARARHRRIHASRARSDRRAGREVSARSAQPYRSAARRTASGSWPAEGPSTRRSHAASPSGASAAAFNAAAIGGPGGPSSGEGPCSCRRSAIGRSNGSHGTPLRRHHRTT